MQKAKDGFSNQRAEIDLESKASRLRSVEKRGMPACFSLSSGLMSYQPTTGRPGQSGTQLDLFLRTISPTRLS